LAFLVLEGKVMKKSLLLSLLAAPCFFGYLHAQSLVGDTLTSAQTADGSYISWKEHLIDDPTLSDVAFSGSDGLVMGDLDRDGFDDVVSVHESDSTYDSTAPVKLPQQWAM
jgi:hypothetical protein